MNNPRIAICGQLITSRVETLEEYFRQRIDFLTVVGITSPFASKNFSRCTFYKTGQKIDEFGLPAFQIRRMEWYKQPLIFLSFGIYFIFIIFSLIKTKAKYDIFIGISCFSSLVGLCLKKINIVKKLIYYSIDYYPPPLRFGLNTINVRIFQFLDRLCVKKADLLWHISPKIADGRERYANVPAFSYRHLAAPLTYSNNFRRFNSLDSIERFTIGFVGTLSENQGLQLLIKAMPTIIKEMPQVKVRIIGTGPYEHTLKEMVFDSNLSEYFIFHGFVQDDTHVLDLLSKCAIGIAPWTSKEDDNILYADPGKVKIYAFCGLPVIVTNGAVIAKEINEAKAGISINYDQGELEQAVLKLLNDELKLAEYKINSYKFAEKFITEKVFDIVWQESIDNLK